MVPPLPDFDPNMTGIVGFLQYTNDITQGMLGLVFLIIVGLVSFLSTKAFSVDRSLAFSTFFTSILGFYLRFLGLVGDGVLVFCISMFAIAVVMLFRERDVEEV